MRIHSGAIVDRNIINHEGSTNENSAATFAIETWGYTFTQNNEAVRLRRCKLTAVAIFARPIQAGPSFTCTGDDTMPRNHVDDTSWGIIDFDDRTGAVFVQQKWLYRWNLWKDVTTPWTYREKQHFHATVNKQIWGAWSNRIRLTVTGTSDAAKRLAGRQLGMNFDVKWVLAPPNHWTVTAWKMPASASPTEHRSFVRAATKRIELNTADLAPRGAMNDAKQVTTNFLTAPHEFGHAILSGSATANPDEYVNKSHNIADASSMMNIGRELRKRHLAAVVTELNKLVPNLTFTIATPAL